MFLINIIISLIKIIIDIILFIKLELPYEETIKSLLFFKHKQQNKETIKNIEETLQNIEERMQDNLDIHNKVINLIEEVIENRTKDIEETPQDTKQVTEETPQDTKQVTQKYNKTNKKLFNEDEDVILIYRALESNYEFISKEGLFGQYIDDKLTIRFIPPNYIMGKYDFAISLSKDIFRVTNSSGHYDFNYTIDEYLEFIKTDEYENQKTMISPIINLKLYHIPPDMLLTYVEVVVLSVLYPNNSYVPNTE